MRETIDFLIQHGYTLLFAWVLVEQLGLPIPSLPLLLAAGALAGAGKFSFPIPIVLAVAACIIADMMWFELGKRRGGKILGLLCRISLEPDSCVRRAEDAFQNHATRSLLLAKFVPGLNTAAPPMAGMTGMSLPRFVLLDSLGALFYAGGAVLVGYLFTEKLEDLAFYLSRLGNAAVVLVVLLFAAYILNKYLARRRFQRELWMARISPEDLKAKLDAGEPLAIVDLRHPLDFLPYPQVIPGAIRLAPSEIAQRNQEIPRDREIILYCT
jgi:membrane protein DedA with SNARE-associated domain